VPVHVHEYGGIDFKLRSDKCADLPEFNPPCTREDPESKKTHREMFSTGGGTAKLWQLAKRPPSLVEVVKWASIQEATHKNTKSRTKRRNTTTTASKLSQV
jgi:hypothetical protein